MKTKLLVMAVAAAVAGFSFAKGSRGLYAGPGARSPMEERLERASARTGESRIDKAAKARQKIKRNVSDAQPIPEGTKVRYVSVSKKCPCVKQTVTATGGARVGVGKTASAAKAAATGRRATNKTTW